jgi:hypothetical protein
VRKKAITVVLLSLAAAGCDQVKDATNRPPDSATMILLDVSRSTNNADIADRYLDNFDLVLEESDAIGDGGTHFAADVIDDNPIAHGTFPIREEFLPCGPLQNSRDCEADRRKSADQAHDRLEELTSSVSQGTDIVGALTLAESYFDAYREVDSKELIILSDMVQSSNGQLKPFQRVENWSQPRVEEMLKAIQVESLRNVRVYVVGAGATAPDQLKPPQIEGMRRFWEGYFEAAGATVEFYGPALPRFPL